MEPLHKTKRGFTLVEMMVSVGIFTIIMTIAIGGLLVVYDAYRKTRTLKNAMENVNVATESMIKKIRTGEQFDCQTSDLNGYCVHLRFVGKDDYVYEYKRNDTNKSIETTRCPLSATPLLVHICPGSYPFARMTAPDVAITDLRFYMYGVDDPNNLSDDISSISIQDSVTVVVGGFANIPGKSQYDTRFNIQTTVSKRLLDVF